MAHKNTLDFNRNSLGFTLSFAVILCVIFSSLLYTIFYFFKINTKESDKAIYRDKAIYLAESGNNRAMARFNVKTLPDITGLNLDSDDDEDDDDIFDDDFDDEDFDDEFFDEEFDDEFDEEFDDLFEEDEQSFLTKIPRYVNFYLINPYYVNIDTGDVVTEAAYYALVAAQQSRIQVNRQTAQDSGLDYQQEEILIEELYFPLPEVNVAQIGTIPIKKGVHLKPGFELFLAEKTPLKIKQANIVHEYYNIVPDFEFKPPRPKLEKISPNYGHPDEYMDIFFDGENLDQGVQPVISGGDIKILEYSSGVAAVAIGQKAKPGRYEIKIGANQTNFFIVPEETEDPSPDMYEVLLPKPVAGERQFIKTGSKTTLSGIKIKGENLSINGVAPIIVPDEGKISITVKSFKPDEIVFDIETNRASLGVHYFSIFTTGGQSNSWAFNVEKTEDIVEVSDPDTGTYSTKATLLEVNSLSNLPLKSFVEAGSSGRPDAGDPNDDGTGGGRPQDAATGQAKRKNFALLKSDLELVWKLETIATVNKQSFKETRIVRRGYPRAEGGLITNSELSFSQSSITFEGLLEALTLLKEPSATGDKKIFVEGEDPDKDLFESRDEIQTLTPTGQAVVEDFFFGRRDQSPASKGFKKDGIVTVIGSNRKSTYSDYGFIKELGPDYIVVKNPGFQESHFVGDEVIQFTPSIITPNPIRERDAERSLDPPGSVAYLPNRENFEYIFKTKLDKLASWGGGVQTSTQVPSDFDDLYEGYFGLNIIEGVPSYTGANALYGQGLLIIDTTKGGVNPTGSTVSMGGSTKLPSTFDGVIYIIGELNITGPVEISGSIIVHSPRDNSTLRVSGSGNVTYNLPSIKKAILHIPFTEDLRTRTVEKVANQDSIIKEQKGKKRR